MVRAQQRKKKGKERLDRYYHLAKEQGFRARSAFKLIQLAQKYGIFTNCRVAVDLCAAPGGWLQVCAKHMPLSSIIVGVDLAPIQPIRGCTTFQGDITTPECRSRLKRLLGGQEADLFLHDGSPNMGMNWHIDAFNQNVLVLHAAHLASEFLRKGGFFVSKVFRSSDYASLLYVLQQLFVRVEATKPQASRNVSAEIFLVCKGFKKPDKIDVRLFNPKFAFLSVEDSEANERADGGSNEGNALGDNENSLVKNKVKLAEVFRQAQKRRRGGYDDSDWSYNAMNVADFVSSESPVEDLLKASELRTNSTDPSELETAILAHKLTTPEIRDLWKDIRVLGKRELSQLLKWRFKLKREFALKDITSKLPSVPAPNDQDDEEQADQKVDEELSKLNDEASRRQMRQQRKALKKQKLLATKQQFSRNVFSADDPDPDLFTYSKETQSAFEKEDPLVDASLLLTGGEPDTADPHAAFLDTVVLPSESSGDVKEVDCMPDMGSVDRMEVDLEVSMRLRELARSERGGGKKPQQKMTRRARAMAERTEELRSVVRDVEARALEHLSRAREVDEADSDDDEDAAEGEGVHERLAVSTVRAEQSKSSGASADPGSSQNAGAKLTSRWFSQPLFSQASEELAECLLMEEFNPVVGKVSSDPPNIDGTLDSADDGIKEVDDANLPQVPLSDKQKRQQKRRQEEMKAKKHSSAEDEGASDKLKPIEEVPAHSFTPPQNAEEAAEFQALGAMLIRRHSRMDLIDGAYNRYAFNDENLPEWFVEDEELHNKPELPVTKELMQEYRQKLKEINSRPIRKVQEAKARKKKREIRLLERVRRQAQGIADSSELTEAGKAKAIARLSKKAKQASGRREKSLIISRRVGGGKAAQKQVGKRGASNRGVKFVDRRLKKDKRAMQRLQKKGGKGRGRTPGGSKGRGRRGK